MLQGDLASAVRQLKNREGCELQVHGSGTLVRFLLDNDLVDASTCSGVTISVYRPTGRPKFGSVEAS